MSAILKKQAASYKGLPSNVKTCYTASGQILSGDRPAQTCVLVTGPSGVVEPTPAAEAQSVSFAKSAFFE